MSTEPWDLFAAAAMAGMFSDAEVGSTNEIVSDAMLAERSKRFGGEASDVNAELLAAAIAAEQAFGAYLFAFSSSPQREPALSAVSELRAAIAKATT